MMDSDFVGFKIVYKLLLGHDALNTSKIQSLSLFLTLVLLWRKIENI